MKRLFAILLFALTAGASERYIIYAHGKAVEDGGRRPETRFGVYEYDAILDTFRKGGFTVISDQRPKDADPSASADAIVKHARDLMKRGVPASHITIIGASKGGVIAMLASTRLANPGIRYVLLGNCNDEILEKFEPRLSGRVLSIYEPSDEFGHTCAKFFARGRKLSKHDEIALSLGISHSFLYSPRKEWVEPALQWAREGAITRR